MRLQCPEFLGTMLKKGADNIYWDFDLSHFFHIPLGQQSFTTFMESFVTKIEITFGGRLRRWKMEERKIVFGHMLIQLWLWYNGTSNQRPMCHFTSKPTTMMMSMPSSSSSSITVKWKWEKKISITDAYTKGEFKISYVDKHVFFILCNLMWQMCFCLPNA